MRTYTLVFSVIAHAIAIAWVIIAPALATDVLPEPPRTSAFIVVKPALPDPPPVVRRATPAPSPAPAPLVPPDGFTPEPPVEPADPAGFIDPGALVGGVALSDIASAGDPLPAPPPPPGPIEPRHVGGIIQAPTKVTEVAPVYPPIALAARKRGLVILEAVIDEEGTVRQVKVLRSDPLFDRAAMDAVKQWRFTATRLNGQPIPVVMTVTVGFNLKD